MRPILRFLLTCSFLGGLHAQVVTKIVGGDWLFPAANLPAINAPLGLLKSVAADTKGNVYIGDMNNFMVMRVSSDGTLSVVAGNGKSGFSGDGGPGRNAGISYPTGLAADSAGNLYIADPIDSRVRKVAPDGTISTVAGTGVRGFSGDGGPASNAQLQFPWGVALDSANNLYITDVGNGSIRKVSPNGTITTIIQPSRTLYYSAIALDTSGNIYAIDDLNHRVAKILPSGLAIPFAGNGKTVFSGDGGLAINAGIPNPKALAVDSAGAVYIVDDQRVRKVTLDGNINTIAGTGTIGFSGDGGQATKAALRDPFGVAVDNNGNIYIADQANFRVRRISPAGIINTFAGNARYRFSPDGVPASSALVFAPSGIIVDPSGSFYVAETGYDRVRKVTPGGTITTVAGNGTTGFSGDGGAATSAQLNQPTSVALDSAGNLYIADSGNNRVRKVSGGKITTFAGNGNFGPSGDGPATGAALGALIVAVDTNNDTLYVNDGSSTVRKITPGGTISTAVSATAGLNIPTGMIVDNGGNLYIADYGNNRVRKLAPNGTISNLAGTGAAAYSGDGGAALNAALSAPADVALDGSGNLYVADSGNNRIRRINLATGIITTFAGIGTAGNAGDGGPATQATITGPLCAAADRAGNVFFCDAQTTNSNGVTPLIFPVSIRGVLTSTVSYTVTPAALSYSVVQGGAAPTPQAVSLSSSIPGLGYTISTSAPWINASLSGGSMPATIQVNVDPSTIPAGNSLGTVTITAPNASPVTRTIAITAAAQPAKPAALGVDTPSLAFSAQQGGGSQSAQIRVSNTGSGSLAFTAVAAITNGAAWLSVSPASGTATPVTPASLTVTATVSALAPGTYQGTITVSAAGSTTIVPVTLSISAVNRVILVTQNGLSFTAAAQGGAPLPQTFSILNTGQGSMSWTATAVPLSGGNWLQISPGTGTVEQPFLDSSVVTATVDPTGMSPGDYYAKILFTSAAVNSPQLLSVLLTVMPAGTNLGPEIRPTGLIFTGSAGSTPGSQDVLVGNLKGQTDNFVSSSLGQGFTYVPANASVPPNQPATLRVFPDFSKLTPGTVQRGAITLLFADGTLRTITVLNLVAPPATSGKSQELQAGPSCPQPDLVVQYRSPQLNSQSNYTAILGQSTNIEVQIADRCGNLIGPNVPAGYAQVAAGFSDGDGQVNLTHTGNGVWSGSWRPAQAPVAPVKITVVAVVLSTQQGGTAVISGTVTTGGSTPLLTAGKVQHAASEIAGIIAPGGLIAVYGSNLSDNTAQVQNLPLPPQLGGTQVLMGTDPLPLLYTSSGQVNAQVPFTVPVNTQFQISVQKGNTLSVPEALAVAVAQPGIFTTNQQGTGQGVIVKSDQVTLAQAGTPANIGETVVIYGTGLGAVTPPVGAGAPAQSVPLSRTDNPVTVTIGGRPAAVSFAGLTPGFAGLYQINAVVPSGITTGDAVPVSVTVAGQTSPATVTMAVR